MLELTIPYPPSINHYKMVGRMTTTKNGKLYQPRVNTPETQRFYYEVWLKIRLAKAAKRIVEPIETLLTVTLLVYHPDKRKRDIDNLIKPTIDSLVRGGLIVDDSQICRLLIERCGIISQGQVIVKVEDYL